MKPNVIILTIPHSVPAKGVIGRSNDLNALNMANSLKTTFTQNGIQTIMIKSKQSRYILDDNRYASSRTNRYTIKEHSELWKNLRESVNKAFNDYCLYRNNKTNYSNLKGDAKKNNDNVYPYILLIDCHSFPPGGFSNGYYEVMKVIDDDHSDVTKVNDDDHPEVAKLMNNEHRVVILDYKPYQKITQLLIEKLNENKIKASLLEGAIGSNSILDIFSLHPIAIPTVLFEVREDLTKSDLDKIAEIVLQTVLS